MKNTNKFLIVSLVISGLFALAGCREDDKVESVDYYKQNKEQRLSVIKECANKHDYSPNCQNATEAQNTISFKTGSVPRL